MAFADYGHTPERLEQNTYGGIGYYRIIKPSENLSDYDVTVVGKEVEGFGYDPESQFATIFQQYDIFWTNYISDPAVGCAIMYNRDKYKKKVIFDIDDNYLDIPESNMLYDKFKAGKKDRAFLSTILSFADAITCSTIPLKERIQQHIKDVHGIDKPIFVIPNLNDIKDWNYKPVEKSIDKVVIGYTGSNSHHDDLKMIMPAIESVMKRHKNVYWEIIGSLDKATAKKFFRNWDKEVIERVAMIGATPTFREYPEWLSQRAWDIGLAPLVDTAFTRCKSSIKWLEYSVYKIPTIASRVYPYFMPVGERKTITNGETGILCTNDWEKQIEKLVLDKELRLKLGENAYNHVKNNWQYESLNGTIKKIIALK